MTVPGPEQTIREYLTAGRARVAAHPVSGAQGWQAETWMGGFDAIPETVQFGKMRGDSRRQVYLVSFETRAGRKMRFACLVRRDDAGAWRFAGCAGGGVDGSPQRGHAWVNLGGGWGPFYAGGAILEDGGEVARVRLRAADGTTLEDTVEDGLVLFITDDEMRRPVMAELIDRSGRVTSQHEAMGR